MTAPLSYDIPDNLQTLQDIYPLIGHLVGPVCAAQIAHVFTQQYRPFKEFPVFLENFPPLKPFPYLGDVARLEWLYHQALQAPEKQALTQDLLSFFPAEIPPLRFAPHPSLALFASPYPLEKMWALTEESLENIHLCEQSSWALIVRSEAKAAIYWLTCAQYTFFESLAQGHTLAQSTEKTSPLCPAFDVQEALQLAFSKGFFEAIYRQFPKD